MPAATAPVTDRLERLAAVLRCVGHPVRLRILSALDAGELSVTGIQEATGEDQATVSRQLAVMRARRVVSARRDGINVYYRIAEPSVRAILACVPLRDGSG
jgi:DNA-binding transcriptional ArsR family regulator